MREFVNDNYRKDQRPDRFVGVQKVGGGNRQICFVVRVPSVKWASSAWRKFDRREDAERCWMEWEGWERFGGREQWMEDGKVPYRDEAYYRPAELKRRVKR